ncbi:VWA domain-containing protein [Moritella sp. Urea-trap-13]|uniref:vWA domain-containing protein n=1 Tax=Moritella sp. Urea-trap-13 TaxID=2058327 RepID=UPI000C321059|nr:VWA domain-containing protein [Moritella sp. Urea-trap-13]PKH06119.1 aerotolerance regulator BatA [Moritella sp. Urea-trap-13]
MIEFAYPWAFTLLALPFLVYWFSPIYKEKKASIQVPYFSRLVDVTGEAPQSGAVVINRHNMQRLLVAFAWCCLVVSMAKPEIVGEPIMQKKSARDLMITVDLSGSMSVEDFTTPDGTVVNRLVAVKQVLSDFVQGRVGDRLGLILFGDAPYLQAPFTDDLTTWLALLNEAEIGMAGQSTAFGDAIGLSINVFENAQSKNRVLIVLTDGNDTASKVPPIDAAKVAAAYDIKIYTIAVGDPLAVGEELVDLKVLNEIASVTGGQSFTALNRQELQQVYQEIDNLEPELFESRSFRPRTSAHHYPIVLFVLCYVGALLIVALRVRRRAKQEG